jgi:hypothetical protein
MNKDTRYLRMHQHTYTHTTYIHTYMHASTDHTFTHLHAYTYRYPYMHTYSNTHMQPRTCSKISLGLKKGSIAIGVPHATINLGANLSKKTGCPSVVRTFFTRAKKSSIPAKHARTILAHSFASLIVRADAFLTSLWAGPSPSEWQTLPLLR